MGSVQVCAMFSLALQMLDGSFLFSILHMRFKQRGTVFVKEIVDNLSTKKSNGYRLLPHT